MRNAGLYIHIPFCTQKCRYCDFYSLDNQALFQPYRDNRRFIEKLLDDIRFFKERYRIEAWKTVYIGGGTPSLLSPADVYRLVSAIRKSQTEAFEECTIEANPEDIQKDWLSACREGGIDRLSVGVQSFDDAVLAANGRRGSGKATAAALDTVKRFWTGQLSCDIIAGLQGQTETSLYEDVRRLIGYRIEHLSLYGLCSGQALPPEREDVIADLLRNGFSLLQKNGYVQYEVSNFSYRNKHQCIHNRLYWNLQPYIGIGPAACGTIINETEQGAFMDAERFEGIRDIPVWHTAQDRLSAYTCESINKKEFLEESLIMGFRLTDGIRRTSFYKRFGKDICELIGATLSRWERSGRCRITYDSVMLTESGLFFLNAFLIEALLELDAAPL